MACRVLRAAAPRPACHAVFCSITPKPGAIFMIFFAFSHVKKKSILSGKCSLATGQEA
jgi:hypothetical protein